MIQYADIIVDLQAGDTGKGKVAHFLSKDKEYTHVVRYNGGGNAGHTVYHNGEKFVTHYIPVGVFYGIKSIIGPGCVVNISDLYREWKELEDKGINVSDYLFIDKRVHMIRPEHLMEDSKDKKIGTTKTGNGPAYRDKYARTGIRAGDDEFKLKNTIDIYEEFYGSTSVKILFEGAQGFELDIDWGDYPYVTSSHCTVGSAIMNGVPPQKIRKVYGVAKGYRTYVGAKQFEGDDEIFNKIRLLGNEYGATTGRSRQVNWLDMDLLIKAINLNGVTDMVFNKIDVLEEAGTLCFIYYGKPTYFQNSDLFKSEIESIIRAKCESVKNIIFSYSPHSI